MKWQHKVTDCLALLSLAAMLMSFCDEIIFSGKIPFFRDLAAYFYPIKFSVAESFKAGQSATLGTAHGDRVSDFSRVSVCRFLPAERNFLSSTIFRCNSIFIRVPLCSRGIGIICTA